jgi:hypothetical protein
VHIHKYERWWMIFGFSMLAAFLVTIGFAAFIVPAILQSLFRWGAVALVAAALAYAGPLLDILHNPGFLAPGMRTW